MITFTIDQAKKHPSNFLYVFVTQSFLKNISARSRNVIAAKYAKQVTLLKNSANKNGKTYNEYKQAVYDAFVSIYNVTPERALYLLSIGKTVAGKNWKKGVYGVGAVQQTTFSQNSAVYVDSKTGHIIAGGKDTYNRNDEYGVVYGTMNGQTVPVQYFYSASDGTSYSSILGSDGKYYADTYATADGDLQSASGSSMSAAESATMWANTILSSGWLQKIIDWFISIFTKEDDITLENTAPNQIDDGFVYESGFSGAGIAILALAAGGVYMASRKNKKQK